MPGRYIHGIHVVAVDEGVELGGRRRGLVSPRRQQRQLLTFLELLQVQDGLGVHTHAGQGLERVTAITIIKKVIEQWKGNHNGHQHVAAAEQFGHMSVW